MMNLMAPRPARPPSRGRLGALQAGGASELGKYGPFEYAVSCHTRAIKQWHMSSDKGKKAFLEQLLHLLAKYARLMLQHPSLYADAKLQAEAPGKYFADLMRKDTRSESKLSDNMLAGILASFDVSPALADVEDREAALEELRAEVFAPVAGSLHADAARSPAALSGFIASLGPLVQLAAHKELAKVVLQSRIWLPPPGASARALQTRSFLGPFFSCTVCPQEGEDPGATHFPNVAQPYLTADTTSTMTYLRKSINSYHTSLHTLIMHLLKIKAMRGRVLDWFALAINLNVTRTQDRHFNGERRERAPEDPTLGTDGFAVNLSAVMLKMCEPITRFTHHQPLNFDKLDGAYLLRGGGGNGGAGGDGPRVQIDSPPLVDPKAVASASPRKAQEPNFVTDCFYMTLACLHIGLAPTVRLYIKAYVEHQCAYQQRLRHVRQHENAPMDPMMSFQMERVKAEVKKSTQGMFCLMTQLHDQGFTLEVLGFYAYVCGWLLHLADPEGKGLPLSESVPAEFGSIPEYVVSDVAE